MFKKILTKWKEFKKKNVIKPFTLSMLPRLWPEEFYLQCASLYNTEDVAPRNEYDTKNIQDHLDRD